MNVLTADVVNGAVSVVVSMAMMSVTMMSTVAAVNMNMNRPKIKIFFELIFSMQLIQKLETLPVPC